MNRFQQSNILECENRKMAHNGVELLTQGLIDRRMKNLIKEEK